jgi:alpha-mannosidase
LGETCREFHFRIALDVSYPMQAALGMLTPAVTAQSLGGPPPGTNAGWLFNIDAPNVQITRILEMLPDPSLMEKPADDTNGEGFPSSVGFALRLVETEGRYRSATLRCFKTPTRARQRDANGLTIAELKVIDDGVHVELSGYEIADIELRFGE